MRIHVFIPFLLVINVVASHSSPLNSHATSNGVKTQLVDNLANGALGGLGLGDGGSGNNNNPTVPRPLPIPRSQLATQEHRSRTSGSFHLDKQSSPSSSPPAPATAAPSTPPPSRSGVEPSTQKLMRTWSQDGSRTWKITEKGNIFEKLEAEKTHLAKVQEEAARRGGVGGGTSDAGGEEDENPFVVLADDYLHCDIDSLCEATLLFMRPYADGLKHSVIHDDDELSSSTSGTSDSLNSFSDIPPHLSPSPPAPVWDTPAISPSGHQWFLPPSTTAAAVVVSLAIGATASVGISFGVERMTRRADGYFQLGVKSREHYFMGYPPGQCGYRIRSITTNRFFTSGNIILMKMWPIIPFI
jgi:hypothetical protein